MTIDYQILGKPGRDNALIVRIDSGQNVSRLLFDCGDGCLDELSISEIQSIDALCFSHLHMDHVGGFDSFFRCTFGRDTQRNDVYGPAETASTLHHRFQGFWWNLCADLKSTWRVHDVGSDTITASEFRGCEAFKERRGCEPASHNGTIITHADYCVRTIELAHNGPSLAYRIDEVPRTMSTPIACANWDSIQGHGSNSSRTTIPESSKLEISRTISTIFEHGY